MIRAALAAAVLIALVAAGCGGSSSDKKASEAYADSVCTAVGNWQQQIKTIATDFSGGISRASIQKKIGQAEDATKTLVSEIKAVPPPNTSQGKAAKQQLSQLSDHAKATIDKAKSTVDQLPANASLQTITGAIGALGPQVQNLVAETKSAIATLKNAGGELGSAFKNTDSCKNLT